MIRTKQKNTEQPGREREGSGRRACRVPNPARGLILLNETAFETRRLIFVSSELKEAGSYEILRRGVLVSSHLAVPTSKVE